MFYYLYEIRNNLNGKIYVGVHKTMDLEDGYMGSGKILRAAIAKYGAENFTKTILEHFESKEEMYSREKEIVTEEFLAREYTYNLRRGGLGGFDYINKNGLTYKRLFTQEDYRLAEKARKKLNWSEINIKRFDKVSHEIRLKWNLNGRLKSLSLDSRNKRIETLSKNKHQQGTKNSQFGTIWITDGKINKKIKMENTIPHGWYRGRV